MPRRQRLTWFGLIAMVGLAVACSPGGGGPLTGPRVSGDDPSSHTLNVPTSAQATVTCRGFSVAVTLKDLTVGVTYTIDYHFTLTPTGGGTTLTMPAGGGTFSFKATSSTQTETIAGDWTLNADYSVTGSVTLTSSNTTIPMTFGGASSTTLNCASLAFACTSSISSNFNNNTIPAGAYIWFNSVFKPNSQGSAYSFKVTSSTITFAGGGPITVPGATITFSPTTTVATTTFASGAWNTKLPTSNLAGNDWLTGVTVPVAAGPPSGTKNIVWTVTFMSNTPHVSLNWQWAAQVYSPFSTNYNSLGVKPVDDNKASMFQNSDHAGTPENFRADIVGAGTGGGGSNFTGSYSGTGSCVLK
jgi:hypothetical protein